MTPRRTAAKSAPDEAPTPAGPRWLDADEMRMWRAFLAVVRVLDEQFERDLQHDSGLGMTSYEILVRLAEAPERTMRMSELARFSQVSRSALSHAVARLEADGWAERSACPTDRRGALCRLTDEGYEKLKAAAPKHVESVRRNLFDQLSARQQDQLRTVSVTLLDYFRAEGVDVPDIV